MKTKKVRPSHTGIRTKIPRAGKIRLGERNGHGGGRKIGIKRTEERMLRRILMGE